MATISSTPSNKSRTYFAFFDLDRTIIRENSGKALARYAYKHGLMTRVDLVKGLFLSLLYKLNLKDPTKIIGTMVSWVKGASVSGLKELATEVFNTHMLASIYSEVNSEIKFHQSEGAGIVILSSTILPVCQNLADYLLIDDIICSNLEVDNGIYTGRLVGPPCFGKEKAIRLIEYCNKNNINPNDSWYYGDAISDFDILNTVGNPVCVNPDKKLRKAASQRGWKILQWK